MTHLVTDSPIGPLTLVGTGNTVTGVYFPNHWTRPDRSAFGERDDTAFPEAVRQLKEYFAGHRTTFDVPMQAAGPDADRAVWAEIAKIPYGATATYGDLAQAVGGLPHEVGAAVGRNPLSILVACHRVVGKNGKLTGYAGGLKRKEFLLELERPPASERGQLW
ncbi:methylated-DNA--[protein]-cysteine S-methyltransferase [Amycolatopsis vancoresmycina]|uniref:Methylated-DNA--protein-cysteine methyltransferase n=1 Tax=Amycolatopsis vancoresmycina DSM 44592 TaxID=1292037 RepID=R1I2L4_9PSEU|nr:methylated-DNA--[protein]-cysteine S-methyltransferase [Amycolatopsis vancoresmycina]EOD64704.1 methylated-DNA-[protein]-cysteine S-methyltransferase [Amycolatopsis vancoresmycina DSM 44592]